MRTIRDLIQRVSIGRRSAFGPHLALIVTASRRRVDPAFGTSASVGFMV